MYTVERTDELVIVKDIAGTVILQAHPDNWIVFSDRFESERKASQLRDLDNEEILLAISNVVELKPLQ